MKEGWGTCDVFAVHLIFLAFHVVAVEVRELHVGPSMA